MKTSIIWVQHTLTLRHSLFFFLMFLLSTGPPSPPRNIMFNLNDTCLMLEWSPPSDSGGRRDLTYNVQCKRCGPEPDQCQLCEEELRFLPRPLGLTNATVIVTDFSAHANYTFEIESLNGVSDRSSFPRQVAIITISTDQSGEYADYIFRLCVAVLSEMLNLDICSLLNNYNTYVTSPSLGEHQCVRWLQILTM